MKEKNNNDDKNRKYFYYRKPAQKNEIDIAYERPHMQLAVSVMLADGISNVTASGFIDRTLQTNIPGTLIIRVGDQFLLDENDDGLRQIFVNEIVNFYKVFTN